MNEDETIAPAEVDGGDLERVRALILAAHPDVVPELTGGATVQELVASIEGARGAYRGVIARMAPAVPPPVPAGAALAVVDPGNLPAHELIPSFVSSSR
jgi:hypothetical protein